MSDLVPEFYLGGLRLDEYPYSVIRESGGVDLGSAEKAMEVIETLLLDGDMTLSSKSGNRTLFVPLLVEGSDMESLAQAEAALQLECDKQFNTFTLVPGDHGFSPTTVYRTFEASAVHTRDDAYEAAFCRRWDLTIPAASSARSLDEIVVDAEVVPDSGGGPPAPIDALVDTCDSITGWTAPGAAPQDVGDGVGTTKVLQSSRLRRTGTVDMSAASHLVADLWWSDTPSVPTFRAVFNGVESSAVKPFAVGPSPYSTKVRRYYFRSPYATLTSFELRADFPTPKVGRILVYEVRKQNNPPGSGTLRQKFFTAGVPGSAPSQGTLEISHPTSGLGTVLVHTTPEDSQGFGPALAPYLTSNGPTTTDTSLVSGGSQVVSSTANVYQISAAQVSAGTYEIGAWMRCNATGVRTILLTTTMRNAAGTFVGGQVDQSTSVSFAAANTWYYFPLGRVQLPTLRVADTSTGLVQLSISATSGTVDLDEAYLFNIERGALTMVNAGANQRVWLKSATADDPMPSVLIGTAADESDAIAAAGAVSAWGVHETSPPRMNAFVVTRTALDAGVRLRLTPAWHTYAAS